MGCGRSLPLAAAYGQAVAAVAVCAEPLLCIVAEKGLVLGCVDLVLGMAGHARWVDPLLREYDVGGRAVAAGSPRFVGDVRIAGAMARGAADPRAGMGNRDLLVQVVGVANEASTIVGGRLVRRGRGRFLVEQQQRLVIQQQRPLDGR